MKRWMKVGLCLLAGSLVILIAVRTSTGINWPPCTPASITSHSGNQTNCSGQSASFSVTASGSSLGYHWRKDGTNLVNSSGKVSGATSNTLTISAVTTNDAGSYDVLVTNDCSSVTSSPPATLTVNLLPTAFVSGDATICAGQSVSIQAILTGTTNWIVTWSDGVVTTNSSSPATRSVSPASTTTYTVTALSDAHCSVGTASGSAIVTVNAIPSSPTASNNGPICAGGTLTLSASTVAGATYSWTGPNSFTSSAQNPSITSVPTAASGTYTVTVAVADCTSVPATTAATVNGAPVVTSDPTNLTVFAGDPASFTAAASGSPDPTVQWQVRTNGGAAFNDLNVETNTTLTFTAGASDNDNQYRAVFSNACGSVTSGVATLTVIPAGLVAWWKFDEGIGTNATDSSGNGHDGALLGTPGPQWVAGMESNAVAFSGSGTDYIQASGDGSFLGLTNQLTISLWVSNEVAATGTLLSKFDTNTLTGSFSLSLSNGYAQFEVFLGGDPVTLVASTAIPDRGWHHLAATYDGTTMKLYLDGGSNAVAAITGTVDVVEADVLLGRDATGAPFAGALDEARLYSLALGADEIAALYNACDSDGDGIPDWWMQQYFGHPTGQASDHTLASDDYDNDGVSNLTEYLQGRDPTKAAVSDTGGLVNLNVYTPME